MRHQGRIKIKVTIKKGREKQSKKTHNIPFRIEKATKEKTGKETSQKYSNAQSTIISKQSSSHPRRLLKRTAAEIGLYYASVLGIMKKVLPVYQDLFSAGTIMKLCHELVLVNPLDFGSFCYDRIR